MQADLDSILTIVYPPDCIYPTRKYFDQTTTATLRVAAIFQPNLYKSAIQMHICTESLFHQPAYPTPILTPNISCSSIQVTPPSRETSPCQVNVFSFISIKLQRSCRDASVPLPS